MRTLHSLKLEMIEGPDRLMRRTTLLAGKVAQAEDRFERCEHARHQWQQLYRKLIECVENLHDVVEPDTIANREFLTWTRSLFPSAGQAVRRPWQPLTGLSPRFAELQTSFLDVLHRLAETTIPMDWVTYSGMQNPFEEHRALSDAQRAAFDELWDVARRIQREMPQNALDSELVKRALTLGVYEIRAFELMYRREVRRRQRARGEYLPERRIPKPEELVMWAFDRSPLKAKAQGVMRRPQHFP